MLTLLLSLAVPIDVGGDWLVSRDVDPVTQAGSVWAIIGSREENFAIGCLSGQPLQAGFRTWRNLGASRRALGGGRPFTYRVGSMPAVTANWDYESSAAVEDRPRPVVQLIEQLSGSSTLNIRILNDASENLDFRFTYPDPARALAEVRHFCEGGRAHSFWR